MTDNKEILMEAKELKYAIDKFMSRPCQAYMEGIISVLCCMSLAGEQLTVPLTDSEEAEDPGFSIKFLQDREQSLFLPVSTSDGECPSEMRTSMEVWQILQIACGDENINGILLNPWSDAVRVEGQAMELLSDFLEGKWNHQGYLYLSSKGIQGKCAVIKDIVGKDEEYIYDSFLICTGSGFVEQETKSCPKNLHRWRAQALKDKKVIDGNVIEPVEINSASGAAGFLLDGGSSHTLWHYEDIPEQDLPYEMTHFIFQGYEKYEDGFMANLITQDEYEMPINIFIDNAEETALQEGDACSMVVLGEASELKIFSSEDEFRRSGSAWALPSLCPAGTFPADNDWEHFQPSPHIIFTGYVIDCDYDDDPEEDELNQALLIQSLNLKFTLFLRREQKVAVGSVVEGVAWLFGEITDEQDRY